MTIYDEIQSELTLRKVRVAVCRTLSDRGLEAWTGNVSVMIERNAVQATHDLIVSLRAPGQDLGKLEVTYPDGWWQAFRQRWMPRWWLRRRPVRWVVERLDAKALYGAIVWTQGDPRVHVDGGRWYET